MNCLLISSTYSSNIISWNCSMKCESKSTCETLKASFEICLKLNDCSDNKKLKFFRFISVSAYKNH